MHGRDTRERNLEREGTFECKEGVLVRPGIGRMERLFAGCA